MSKLDELLMESVKNGEPYILLSTPESVLIGLHVNANSRDILCAYLKALSLWCGQSNFEVEMFIKSWNSKNGMSMLIA